MKNLSYIFSLILIFSSYGIKAQSSIDDILDSIRENYPGLQAARLNMSKEQLAHKTGLTLPNPELEYGSMFPKASDNRLSELTIKQAFDFPNKYFIQNKLAKQQIEGAVLDFEAIEQDVILNAKLMCLEIIYLNKTKSEIDNRLIKATVILELYEQMLEQGETSLVELNKIKLFHLSILNQQAAISMKISTLANHLAELNNGKNIVLEDTAYPLAENIDNLEQLQNDYFNSDPELRVFENISAIGEKQIALSKTSLLPSFAAGYKMEKTPKGTIDGVVFGLTIPLWEHKNKIKYARANAAFNNYKLLEIKHKKTYELKTLFQKYITSKEMLEKYSNSLREFNNRELLDLSLKSGNISVIEYITELSMIYESIDEALWLEKEYQLTIAELLKYKLIQ